MIFIFQIQIVLYETHSIVTAENSDMVSHLVKEVNQAALEKHAEEKGRLVPTGPSLTEESYNEMQVRNFLNSRQIIT